jgi:hypothetical protein
MKVSEFPDRQGELACTGRLFMITKTFTPRKRVKVFVKPESSPLMTAGAA